MELCVDLKEITRISYHELETVYFSVNLVVLPNRKRYLTGPSFGQKSIKFRPHRFEFIVNDIKNSQLSLTILSHLTDNRSFIISYLTIPLISIPINGYATKQFETILSSPISVSPIVKLTLGLNINYTIEKPLDHPRVIKNVEYENYESPPVFKLDCFGKLKPPKHYIDKCASLVETNQDLFNNLLFNDSLRKYVLDKALAYFQNTEDISSIFENEQKKKEISNQNSDFNINNKIPIQRDLVSETKKKKSKKESDSIPKPSNQKHKFSHSPQPPVEPKTKSSRNEDSKNDVITTNSDPSYQTFSKNKSKINSDMNNEIVSSVNNACNSLGISIEDDNQSKTFTRTLTFNQKTRSKAKIQPKSLTIASTTRNDSDTQQSFSRSCDSPSFVTQKPQSQPQQSKMPVQQQQFQPSQQSKVQMPQQQQPQQPKIQSQLQQQQKIQQQQQQKLQLQQQKMQQPQQSKLQLQLPQQPQPQPQSQQSKLQLQLPQQPQPQPQSPYYQTQAQSPLYTSQPQSPFYQSQPPPSTAEIGIQKMISKKKTNDYDKPFVKGIFQQKINVDNDKSQSGKQMKRGILVAKQIHKFPSKGEDNENEFTDRRAQLTQMPAKKPKPPTQIQLPITTLQTPIDGSSVNPRRARQIPEF